jgi:hypothetical protein
MRRPLLLVLLLALVAAAPATAARTYRVDVPAALAKQTAAVERRSAIPVLLPSRLISEKRRLYGGGGRDATEAGYRLRLDARRGCGGANACNVAFFSAARGEEPTNEIAVKLPRGITGYFRPLACGASCADPSIEWVQDGVLYEIQAAAGTARTEKRRLTDLARSAIRNGPR